MKSRTFNHLLFTLALVLMVGCSSGPDNTGHVRPLADTVGFAQYDHQMDRVVEQINSLFGEQAEKMLQDAGVTSSTNWKVAISPHDDYAYAGFLYPAVLKNVRAHTIILFGVAHKARVLSLEDQAIFDSYTHWKGPYGDVAVSAIREEIIGRLPAQSFQVNDSMHRMEHSLEALVPFLQYQHRDVEIVPILIPYMPYEKMNSIAIPLAEAIRDIAAEKNWQWGRDYALVISNDAVHYGDEDWGGKNYARFGTDSAGYHAAVAHEWEIIRTITGELKPANISSFCNFTVEEDDYKTYKWPWCGRYSVPFGLLTAFHLNHLLAGESLIGYPVGYATSIDHQKLEVESLGMGVTAPAKMGHWVGYAAIGYN